ncbi:hypothetical protein TWF694_006569 [Orbilia ellipsospora]|uniref:Uncharacterized protein n=1 Tax=Orbilia ellipsospora TaxID=2528407 RepID=A0AAV9XKX6_9PEZI
MQRLNTILLLLSFSLTAIAAPVAQPSSTGGMDIDTTTTDSNGVRKHHHHHISGAGPGKVKHVSVVNGVVHTTTTDATGTDSGVSITATS